MVEFEASWDYQEQFILGFLLPYLTEVFLPLGIIRNPDRQSEDIPAPLTISQSGDNGLAQ